MGRPDVGKAVDGPEFELFVRLLREHPNIWSKVSCPERLSKAGPPNYDDVVPFANSEELVSSSGLPSESLIEVGAEHRLADEESLKKMVEAVEKAVIARGE